jgi:hypothetical protein
MRRARPGSAAALPSARWWTLRAARSRKPATYRCPFCGRYLLAATDHVLIAPEGDPTGRRHAHLECVRAARAAGRLPTREEWRRASGGAAEERGWRRVWRRGKP